MVGKNTKNHKARKERAKDKEKKLKAPCPDCGMNLTEAEKTLYHTAEVCHDHKRQEERKARHQAKKRAGKGVSNMKKK